jgi:hypothetical protein
MSCVGIIHLVSFKFIISHQGLVLRLVLENCQER